MFKHKKEQSAGDFDFDSSSQRTIASSSVKRNLENDENKRAVKEIINSRATNAYSIVDNFVTASAVQTSLSDGSGNMTVGPGVQMQGAIRNFEKLVILGSSEGELEGENLTIGEGGFLKGTASIRNMEVVGEFQGTASVAGHIHLRSTGSIDGQVTYSSIEIENGGQIKGEMSPAQNGHSSKKSSVLLNENSSIDDTAEFSSATLRDEGVVDG